MKRKPRALFHLSSAIACLALSSPLLHAGTITTTFNFQKGNLLQDGNPYGSGTGYAGVVDGRVTDNTAASALSTAATSATIGNQFQNAIPANPHNGQQHCGLFSYDLTELNSFIAANTGPYSSVTIQSVSFTLVSSSTPSGTSMGLNLYGTDPFTSAGCTWANYTTGTPWTVPYQSGRTETTYNFAGGPTALTASLGGSNPSTGATGTPIGTALTWTSSASFISALSSALARTDKTLYLTARGSFFNTGDNRVNVNTSPATTVANRPKLVVTLDVTTTAAPATWTGTTSNSWTTATNWSPAGVPATDAPITFDASSTANLNTVLNQDFAVTSVTVSSPSGAVSIGGANNLNLGTGGFDLSAATQNLSVSTPVVMGAIQTWNVASGRTLGVSGVVSGNFPLTIAGAGKVSTGASNILPNGASAGNLTVNGTLDLNGTSQSVNGFNGSGTLDNTAVGSATLTVGNNDAACTFTGIIQDTGGALAVVKAGSGQLLLTGANDFSGGFTNNGTGNVVPNNSLALGTGPVVSNAGTIYPTAVVTFGNSLALNGSNLRIGGGSGRTIAWNGPVTVTGTSGLVCDGGTNGITLGNTLDITGATFNSSANGTTNSIVGDITGVGGNLNVTLGTLQLSGANNTYSGTTTIGAGCFLRLDATGTLPASGNVVINGALTIRNTNGWTHSGTISGSGAGVISMNTGTNATLAGGISGVASINVSTSGTNAAISGAISGAAAINVQSGGATLSLSGNNSYTGATNLTGGTLALAASNVLPDATAVAIGNATLDADAFTDTAGTLDATSSATIHLGTGAALAFADSSAVDWTGGSLNITGTFVSGSSLRFGTTSGGLTSTQQALITVNGAGGGTYSLDGNGYLVQGVSGYSNWKTANSTSQTIELDHDNDGVANGVEYFLSGGANSTGFTALPGVTNTAGTLSITWTKAAGYTGTYGTDFVVETSSTLNGAWTAEIAAPNPGATVTISGNDVKFTFPAGTKNFARLKVTGP